MIQDIAPFHYDNTSLPLPPEGNSYALFYESGKALLREDAGGIDFPRMEELERWVPDLYESAIYLFTIDQDRFYLIKKGRGALPCGFAMKHRQIFRGGRPRHLAFAGITGYQLFHFYRHHLFCSACGGPMRPDEKERMLYCAHCHRMVYPRISPAVIVGVVDGDRILLTQYAHRDYKRYALIAGYNEIGETLEDTVRREVLEETGLRVKNLRYYKSQPWSFTETLLAGFYCDLDGPDTVTLDRKELALAQWFHRDEIQIPFNNVTLTNEMILHFKDKRSWPA